MPARKRALDRRVSEACLRLMAARHTANISFTDLAEATGDISSRTLRRHFPTVAAAAYPTTWWLPRPADAIRKVLAPRERIGPCWPPDLDDPEVAAATAIEPGDEHFAWPPAGFFEALGVPDPLNPGAVSPQPITLRNLLNDLHALDRRWSSLSGYRDLEPGLEELRGTTPELDAWYVRALHRRADALAAVLARVFGLPFGAARACAHGYAAIPESTAPIEVAAHLTAFAHIITTGVTVPPGPGGPIAPAFRAIDLPVREPERARPRTGPSPRTPR